jgi:hypothetical protein
MSVWKDRESLCDYVYNSGHIEIFKRRKEWFSKMPKMHIVLGDIQQGPLPTLAEAKERLEHLQQQGESEYAFSFKSKF